MRSLIFASFALAACSPYSPDLGPTPFFCGSAMPQCPDGYACMNGSGSGAGSALCVRSTGGGTVDTNNLNGMCADDSPVETSTRNDTITTAYSLPDLSTRPNCSFVLSSLAICPMGDKDDYSLVLTSDNKTITADVMYDTWGSPLQGAIANSGGTPIKTLQTGGTNDVSGSASSLPAGQYFIEVFGPASAPGINNYKLTVTMTPCP